MLSKHNHKNSKQHTQEGDDINLANDIFIGLQPLNLTKLFAQHLEETKD